MDAGEMQLIRRFQDAAAVPNPAAREFGEVVRGVVRACYDGAACRPKPAGRRAKLHRAVPEVGTGAAGGADKAEEDRGGGVNFQTGPPKRRLNV
jgi:hypothetical protein